jgi:acyl-CoA thioesterase-1
MMLRSCLVVLMLLLSSTLHAATAPVVLVLGDSLSAGYGLDVKQGWVHLLEQRLKSQGLPHTVVNASVSGETTAGGLARLPALLERHRPKLVLVELGGNDGLRALPIKAMRGNLERIVEISNRAGATAVLFEMRIPENYGPAYGEAFTRTFSEVAAAARVPLVPFLLADFATDATAFQDDGIHPSAAAQPRILDTIWPSLLPLLKP